MEGITILNQTIHEGSIIEPYFTIGLVSLAIGIALVFCSIAINGKVWKWMFISTTCLAAFGMALCLIIGTFAPRDQIARYQVLIDDNVSLLEFNEQYKIVDQEGLIYTIEEREP